MDERSQATKHSSIGVDHRPFVSTTINSNVITSTSICRDVREKERAFTACKYEIFYPKIKLIDFCVVDLREYRSDLNDSNSKTFDDDWKKTENVGR